MVISLPLIRLMLSGLIVVILGLQAFIGIRWHHGHYWPFVSYPMYANSHHEMDRIRNYTLTAVFEDGRSEPVDESRLGWSFWILREHVHLPIVRGGFNNSEVLQKICDIIEGRDSVVRLDVYDTGITVRRDGPHYGAPERQGSVDVTCRS